MAPDLRSTGSSPSGQAASHLASKAAAIPRASAWAPRQAKYDWRSFLTAEEAATLAAADAAKTEWQRLNSARAAILNRAIQRAKHAAKRGGKA